MKLKSFIILFASVLGQQVLFGQEKNMRTKDVPAIIQNYISSNYPSATKLKFYVEKGEDLILIESEFSFKGEKYSLAFKNDTLIEIEIFRNFVAIPSNVQATITVSLDSLFSAYKIIECQEVNPQTNLRYEILVKGTSEKSTNYFELFFDSQGSLLRKVEVEVEPIPSQN